MAGVQKHIDIQKETMLDKLLEYVNSFYSIHRRSIKFYVVPQLCFDAMIVARNARHSLPNVMTRSLGDHQAFLEDFVFLADIMAD